MSSFGRKFYDVLRIHFEQGTKIEYLNLNDGQKDKVRIIEDLYEHYRHNPKMNMNDYIRNKYNITGYAEIYNLTRALNFVVGMFMEGRREMTKFKALHYADRMAAIGDATGDWKPIDKAIGHWTKIERLDQPDPAESFEDQIPKMGYLLTTDATEVSERAVKHTPAQIEAMFKRYGVERDKWQQMLDKGASTADDYDADGKLIRRGRSAMQTEAEDAEFEALEAEWQAELESESPTINES